VRAESDIVSVCSSQRLADRAKATKFARRDLRNEVNEDSRAYHRQAGNGR